MALYARELISLTYLLSFCSLAVFTVSGMFNQSQLACCVYVSDSVDSVLSLLTAMLFSPSLTDMGTETFSVCQCQGLFLRDETAECCTMIVAL